MRGGPAEPFSDGSGDERRGSSARNGAFVGEDDRREAACLLVWFLLSEREGRVAGKAGLSTALASLRSGRDDRAVLLSFFPSFILPPLTARHARGAVCLRRP